MLLSRTQDSFGAKRRNAAALAIMAAAGLFATAAGPLAQPANAAPAAYRPCSGKKVSCAGVAKWASYYYNHRADYFSDDCTNFASFSLYAGGQRMVHRQFSSSSNDHYWYVVPAPRGILEYWSHSWTVSRDLATFFKNNRAHFTELGSKPSGVTSIRPGMIIFAALGGGGFGQIDHAGVVVKVLNRNIMIAQHSVDTIEPLWPMPHNKGWFGKSRHLQHVWIGDPSSLP
jgi:hypothetical protein